MKIGLFLLYGIIMLLLSMLVAFIMNGGSIMEKDKDGYIKLRIKGGIRAEDWVKILCLSVGVGFFVSIAAVSAWCGLIAYVALFFAMLFIAFWCYKEASALKDLAIFIIMMVVVYLVSQMSVIALSGIVRHYAWLSIFKTVPAVVLCLCITVVIAEVLRYQAEAAHLRASRSLSEDIRKIFPVLRIIVIILGIGIATYLLITGIQWKGF